jgi:hypothetical protein
VLVQPLLQLGHLRFTGGRGVEMSTNILDVTEWYRKRYRGVVAAERLGAEVLVLFDEGESYGVSHRTLGFPGTDREVVLRCWVDRVPRSRIDPTRPLFAQWAD